MPIQAKNSSSPLGSDDLGDHIVYSSCQETNLVRDNLQDMVVRHVLTVGRNVIGVRRTGRRVSKLPALFLLPLDFLHRRLTPGHGFASYL
jgi:hypothetical protein